MVIVPRQHAVSAFLDDALVHACAQHNLRRLGVAAATATAGCQRELGNGRTALVLQRHRLGAVVAFLHVAVKQGRTLYLAELAGYGAVLHRVRTLGVQAGVHRHLVHRQVYVALGVGGLLLAVQRHALHRAATAEIVPAALALPAVQAGTDKLLRLPLALAHLEGYTRAFHALLLLHGSDGGGKGVKAIVQRIGLRHVDGIAAAGAAGLHKGIIFVAPGIECVALQVEFVLPDAYRVSGQVVVHFTTFPRHAVSCAILADKQFLRRHVVDGIHTGEALLRQRHVIQYAGKTGCGTVPGQHCHVLILFHHGFGCLRGLLRRFFRIRGRLCRCLCRLSLCVGIARGGIGGSGCSFCRCFRCQCLRCRIGSRLAQQTYRRTHQFRAAKRGQGLHPVKARHFLQFRHALALALDGVQHFLLDFLFLLLCHS